VLRLEEHIVRVPRPHHLQLRILGVVIIWRTADDIPRNLQWSSDHTAIVTGLLVTILSVLVDEG